MTPIKKHWYVLINPEQYSDDNDCGYGWTGEADNEMDAIRLACRSCEEVNDWEVGEVDELEVNVAESGPDTDHHARQLLAAVKAHDADLNTREVAPTGDDYNILHALVIAWLGNEADRV